MRVVKKADVSLEEPIANSSMLALPSKTKPSLLRRSITVASYGGTKFSSILEPQVVLIPFVHNKSFMIPGIPVRGAISPAAMRLSA